MTSTGTTRMITTDPTGASVPGAGLCCQTWPSVNCPVGSSACSWDTTKPAASSSWLAVKMSWPSTSGTVPLSAPTLTTMVTADPSVSSVPGRGSWRMTTSGATSSLASSCTATTNPRRSSARRAARRFCSRTSGTSTVAASFFSSSCWAR